MTSATPTRGRPRSSDRTEAILDAAHDVLKEHGFDNVRMQDIADQAGAGLATIYRRWETKEDLVILVTDGISTLGNTPPVGREGPIVVMHAAWLLGLWYLAWEAPVNLFWLAVFVILQGLRVWGQMRRNTYWSLGRSGCLPPIPWWR